MTWLLTLALLTAPPPADEVDHLGLAAIMLRDGHLDRAAKMLEAVDPTAEGLDQERYYTLTGLVAFRQKRHRDAAEALDKAWEVGSPSPTTQLLVAQARFQLGEWRETVAALDRAGEAARSKPESVIMRVQALWNAKDKVQAWLALSVGLTQFPEHPQLTRRRLMMLVALGLYQTAATEGAAWVSSAAAAPRDVLALAEALRHAKAFESAIAVLEEARLRYPADLDFSIALSRAWLDSGKPLAAATVMEMAAWQRPSLAVEAAELFRRAGKLNRAIQLNARVEDQTAKFKQRLGLLLEQQRYESASALEPRLRRLGLLEMDDIRYAVGYASFRVGEYEAAARVLRGISNPDLFRKAAELKKAILACGRPGARCQ